MNNLAIYSKFELQFFYFLTIKSSRSSSCRHAVNPNYRKGWHHERGVALSLSKAKFTHTKGLHGWLERKVRHSVWSLSSLASHVFLYRSTCQAFQEHTSYVHFCCDWKSHDLHINSVLLLCLEHDSGLCECCVYFHKLTSPQRPSTPSCVLISGLPQESRRNVCWGTATVNK